MSDLSDCPRCGVRLVLDDTDGWVCPNPMCLRYLQVQRKEGEPRAPEEE